jgi:hypothetical protein
MTKGITVTSAIMTISGRTEETVAGTMAEEQVSLSLDILSREVLLIYAIDMNPDEPDTVAGANSFTEASLSSTSRATLGTIANTNVLGAASKAIRGAGYVDGGVSFQDVSPETPTSSSLDYIGIVSTNDFFVQVKGFQNTGTKGVNWRVWSVRAKVTADIYAALVQSEALSA